MLYCIEVLLSRIEIVCYVVLQYKFCVTFFGIELVCYAVLYRILCYVVLCRSFFVYTSSIVCCPA